MVVLPETMRRGACYCSCIAAAIALCMVASATPADTILVWKVGSPHTGEVPDATVPPRLESEAGKRGLRIVVRAFPAKGFAATFFDAVARNAAPDVLAFDNFGVMDGMTTALGTFQGIGKDPTFRKHLIQVTESFDDLLSVLRGWTYLFDLSANYRAARSLALRSAACPDGSAPPELEAELGQIVPRVATAYLEGNTTVLQTYSDLDRLPTGSSRQSAHVQVVQPCGLWGNDRLAFAWVKATYEADAKIGVAPVLVALRKPANQWQLLVAASDPISNRDFVAAVPALTTLFSDRGAARTLPAPATLLSPATGVFPPPARGQRFGDFRWRSSTSDGVVAEIAEFAYQNDVRLVFLRPAPPGSRRQISTGTLWTTRDVWNWRIWSIAASGDVSFSESRMFTH